MNFLDRLERATFRLNTGLIMLSGWAILIVMFTTTYGVMARYFLDVRDTWSHPVSAYLLCLIIFLSAAHTLQENVHVRVDYLTQAVSRRVAIWLYAIGDIASSIFLTIFAWQLCRLFNESFQRGRIDETTLSWPLVWIQWVLPLGAVLLLITHFLLIAMNIRRGTYGKSDVQVH